MLRRRHHAFTVALAILNGVKRPFFFLIMRVLSDGLEWPSKLLAISWHLAILFLKRNDSSFLPKKRLLSLRGNR